MIEYAMVYIVLLMIFIVSYASYTFFDIGEKDIGFTLLAVLPIPLMLLVEAVGRLL